MTYAIHEMSFRGGPKEQRFSGVESYQVSSRVYDTLVGNCKAACVVNEKTGKVVARYTLEYSSEKGCWVRVHTGGKKF